MLNPETHRRSAKLCPHCFKYLTEVIFTGYLSCPDHVYCDYEWANGSRVNKRKGILAPIPASKAEAVLIRVRRERFEVAVAKAAYAFSQGVKEGEETAADYLVRFAYHYKKLDTYKRENP